MSELINNLQQIYNAKLAIKSAIGTQSDELVDYASYINALKPDGYTYINENGDYDVAGYEYAYVNVPAETEVEGYAYITTNGDFNISTYEMVNVDVPIDWNEVQTAGYIVPSGTYNITTNGTVDIAAYSNAYVNVQAISGHDGLSVENAYTVAEAIQRFSIASQDDFIYGSWVSDNVTYVTGIISKIHEISTQYHNCTFTISDDGTYETSDQYVDGVDGADNLLLYRQGMEAGVWNMPSDTAPKVGDKITVYGKWTGATDYVIDEGFSTYWDNGANVYCGVSSLYREAPSGGYTVTQNGSELDLSSYSYVNVNVAGGGSEPESYTLQGGLFINGQGQYYIADEGDLADYINIIPKEDVTGPGFPNTAFSYLTVGKDTTITGYNYYNGDAFAIQVESYTQSSSIAYQTARLANIEPYLIKQYYGLGKYYDSAYITVNRSFNFPNGTQLGISREVFGYYFPIGNTNRYKDLMVDVSYITPAGDDILGLQATAMAFDNTTYALDLRNIRYCDDYMVYDNTYVTPIVGIDGGTVYYEIDLTQSGNYDDSSLYNSILSGGAFFADMPNNTGDSDPIVHKLEVPSGTFKFDDSNWILDNGIQGDGNAITGGVVFNEDHNNNPTLQIDTTGVWAYDDYNENWYPTGIGELTVNGINSLKIRFYVDSSDNTWQYDWLIDVDYEYTPDDGGEEEPEPEE